MGQHTRRYTFCFFLTERGVKVKKGKWKAAANFIILTSANFTFNSIDTKIKDI